MSGEAILSAENSGKPLGGRRVHSAPQEPYGEHVNKLLCYWQSNPQQQRKNIQNSYKKS